ncbi:MAG: T9SS type A sorting domain-containing protein [bacterium]
MNNEILLSKLRSLIIIFISVIELSSQLPGNQALLEPEDGKVYHGVQTMTFANTPEPLEGYLSAINDSTIQPAVRGFFFSIPGERGPANTLKGLINFFHTADSVGFIPELSLFLVGKTATDSIIAESDEYDWILDSIITLSKNYGRGMFLRIGGEFNGAGEGWNGGGYHPYIYVSMFRKIVDMFEARGFRDSVAVNWCYEPDAANDFDSVDVRGARWYPGDDYVDWFGLDVFQSAHFDQSLPDGSGRNITKKGKSERFLAMAREKGKPVFLSETSAHGINISSDEQDGINDWNNWFAKFFEFIDVHKEIKGFCYIDANWPKNAYPDWGDARIENNTYVTEKYIEEMRKAKYIHLYDEINIQPEDTLPLTELGTGTWKNYEGGLYPDGENVRPAAHNTDGIEIANSILPLDNSGNPDNAGKIVLLSIGMSNCTQEFSAFKMLSDTFQFKNPKLLIVDGAQGGQTASIIKDPSANFWTVVNQRLQQQNVSANQVQAVWLKEANHTPSEPFPVHAELLKNDLKTIVQVLKNNFSHLKIVYLSSRIYGGYSTTALNPEPYAYESGFSVKWLIEEQINGDDALSYSGEKPKAPWLSWGPYLWAKGTTTRQDGLQWLIEDFGADGTHPSTSGRLKVANLLLDFFVNDETSKPWFLASEVSVEELNLQDNIMRIYPNPASEYIEINIVADGRQQTADGRQEIQIYNVLGECVITVEQTLSSVQRIDVTGLPPGVYFIRIGNQTKLFVKY